MSDLAQLSAHQALRFVFEWTLHLEPSDKKRMILQMREPDRGWLSDEAAQFAINALSLRDA